MKHVSNIMWSSLALLYNAEKRFLLHHVTDSYITEIRRRMSHDKEYMAWLKRDDFKRYTQEVGEVEFRDLIYKHGYDELCHDTDNGEYHRVISAINYLSKKEAVDSESSSYKEYRYYKDKGNPMCRCGEWYFFFVEPKYDRREIDYTKMTPVKKQGGKREGSGRKSQYSKLEFPETTTIKVPKWEKDKIKKLINWLIDNHDIRESLAYAVSVLEGKSEEEQKYWPEGAERYRLAAEDVKSLRDVIPYFYYAENEGSEEKVTESNQSDNASNQ